MPEKRPPIIIHHKGCNDGICGAMILWLGLPEGTELMAYHYNWDPPADEELNNRDVWMVDFSFPRETLLHIHDIADNVVVLDHHGTAQENCAGLDFAIFDMNRSGAMIAYDYMIEHGYYDKQWGLKGGTFNDFYKRGLKNLAQYVQDRDLWKFELPDSREISAWLSIFPKDLETWLGVLEHFCFSNAEGIIAEGKAILRNNDHLVNIVVAQAWKGVSTTWTGEPVTAWVANSPILQSDVGHALTQRKDTDCAVIWRRAKRGRYFYSVRSLSSVDGVEGDTFDVAKMVEPLGGGGHKAASGFTSVIPPWELFEEIVDD